MTRQRSFTEQYELKEQLHLRGIQQKWIAFETGMSQPMLSDILNGKRQFTLKSQQRILNAISEFDRTHEPPPPPPRPRLIKPAGKIEIYHARPIPKPKSKAKNVPKGKHNDRGGPGTEKQPIGR